MTHLFASASVMSDKLTVGHLVAVVGLIATVIGVIYGRHYITNLKMGIGTFVTGLLTLAAWFGTSQYQAMQFDAKAKDYLVAAYKTDDKEKAKKYIDKALSYLHEIGADEGHSAVFAGGQTDDLAEYAADLKKVREDMDAPEGSAANVSLSDSEGKEKKPKTYKDRMVELGFIRITNDSPEVQYPSGMRTAPNNFGYAMWMGGGIFLALLGAGLTTTRIIQNACDKNRVMCQHCNGEGYNTGGNSA